MPCKRKAPDNLDRNGTFHASYIMRHMCIQHARARAIGKEEVEFTRIPSMVVVRPDLSKAREEVRIEGSSARAQRCKGWRL